VFFCSFRNLLLSFKSLTHGNINQIYLQIFTFEISLAVLLRQDWKICFMFFYPLFNTQHHTHLPLTFVSCCSEILVSRRIYSCRAIKIWTPLSVTIKLVYRNSFCYYYFCKYKLTTLDCRESNVSMKSKFYFCFVEAPQGDRPVRCILNPALGVAVWKQLHLNQWFA
jgi:hypothetical protein